LPAIDIGNAWDNSPEDVSSALQWQATGLATQLRVVLQMNKQSTYCFQEELLNVRKQMDAKRKGH